MDVIFGRIYKIENDINDKIYFGSTQDKLSSRWRKHLYKVHDSTKYTSPLYKLMRSVGVNHFSILLVDHKIVQSITDLLILEDTYIDSFKEQYPNLCLNKNRAIRL